MRTYGLIGYPLSHSFSEKYFQSKFEAEHIRDCVYQNFPIPDIEAVTPVLQKVSGLNVTIPYKEKVIPYLHAQTDVVKAIGACNCIKIVEGKAIGYNTDVKGFEDSFRPRLQPHHKKALVLGTGGAAKAVHYVLGKLGIGFVEVSRTPREGQISYEQINLEDYQVVINTSPLGMYPKVDECPPIPYEQLTPAHYLFDLIYNPIKTLFLQKGAERGAIIENGKDMLVIQAEESWRIWNDPSL